MTKEARIPNYRKRAAGETVDSAEEAFWMESEASEAVELREDAINGKPVFDLEERTARFGEAVIRFAKKIPPNPVNNRLIEQLVGAATSVGANYCEADDGVSGKEFKNKIGSCAKSTHQTKVFLRIVATSR